MAKLSGKEVVQGLIVRSMTLEMAREANLLTRFDVEHFISKLEVWVREEFNADYAKMWDAFREGRRPL